MQETELSSGVKMLRRVVITMGYVLVIGTIALMIAAYFKFTNKPATPEKSYAMQDNRDKCSFKSNADIEVVGNIASSSINGNILTIITGKSAKPGSQIVVFDLCVGEVLSRLNIIEN